MTLISKSDAISLFELAECVYGEDGTIRGSAKYDRSTDRIMFLQSKSCCGLEIVETFLQDEDNEMIILKWKSSFSSLGEVDSELKYRLLF